MEERDDRGGRAGGAVANGLALSGLENGFFLALEEVEKGLVFVLVLEGPLLPKMLSPMFGCGVLVMCSSPLVV